MKPTRRAVVFVCVCGLALWLAGAFGARSLNAVVVPLVVALVAAVVQLGFTDRPTAHRSQPEAGFPGDFRTVEIDIATDDPVTARITDRTDDGLDTGFVSVTQSLPATVEYEVELTERGEHRLGPLTLTVRDALGLATKTFQYPKRTPVLVYPTVYDLADAPGVLPGPTEDRGQRETFDELREYVRGDSLRDVHWKSSAKHDDLVVMEFDSETSAGGVTVAAEATPDYVEEMAVAAASVAIHLLDRGFAVSLSLPNEHVERGSEESHRERVLGALARATAGRADTDDADIRVVADANGTRLTRDDRDVAFERFIGGKAVATDGGVER